jgi:WhiB family transcriptional regulator, redox-sensing transcriptional regulator
VPARAKIPSCSFPIAAAGPALEQVFAAKAVCFRCAVRAACLFYALVTGQAGTWGGTTQEERHAMRGSPGLRAREHSGGPGSQQSRRTVTRARRRTAFRQMPRTIITDALAAICGTHPGRLGEP